MDFSELSEVPDSEKNERADRDTMLPGAMGSGTPDALGENVRHRPIPVSDEIESSGASAPIASGVPEGITPLTDPVQVSALR
jgi:hypothetical protein